LYHTFVKENNHDRNENLFLFEEGVVFCIMSTAPHENEIEFDNDI